MFEMGLVSQRCSACVCQFGVRVRLQGGLALKRVYWLAREDLLIESALQAQLLKMLDDDRCSRPRGRTYLV